MAKSAPQSSIKHLREITKDDAPTAGGKGASLGEMLRAGIPVPPGFVVLAEAFDHFLAEANLTAEIDTIMHDVDPDSMHTVEEASNRIQRLIRDAEMPASLAKDIDAAFAHLDAPYVAVRSSATAEDSASAAWAGQLESYLNTTKDTLRTNVQNCWASLFTPRAIFYRFEMSGAHESANDSSRNTNVHALLEKISVAVVVQEMVDAEKSGIAFSVHPVTEDKNQLIIEAGFGLGEAIVAGHITPDSYVVEKTPRRILDVTVAEQKKALYRRPPSDLSDVARPHDVSDVARPTAPAEAEAATEGPNEWRDLPAASGGRQVLTEAQIEELAALVCRIEDHYSFPVDVEWAYANDAFYITQSRPITTLSSTPSAPSDSGRIHFEKTLDRDATLIMQLLFIAAMTRDMEKRYGVSYDGDALFLQYVNGDSIELYENKDALAVFIETLQKKHKEGTAFAQKLHEDYEKYISRVEKRWKEGPTKDPTTLNAYMEHIRNAVLPLALAFYSGLGEEKLSDEVEAMLTKIRGRVDFFADGDEYIRDCLECQGVARKNANVVFREEITDPPEASVLEKRLRGLVLVDGKNPVCTTLERFAENHTKYHIELFETSDDLTHIEGQIAYRGVVRGVVRVVKNREKAEQVENGEILVSPMTTPDFLSAMKKAAAFVTDEGGVTCHAAIVARELKKPCIIGTKVATQVLTDGDLVEVDADTGVVRKINAAH